ncbi:uncharacterized protein N7479_007071 [Penicillium vulpinum]|uniref:uncharacterized protein n=1 Tax=Penicillium vulpinum TaxID=29845 RepID=UPI0025483661|nr:uncharacterized protein N7479_007071 [Penicillium vulpinum]KAJ5959921.1 hypothetical protein N7479_007071 [Penicillium vulpinum]
MAEPESAKRARSNTIGDAHVNTTPLEEISQRVQHLEDLDPDAVVHILAQAAQIHPDVMGMVDQAIRAIREIEQNRILTFDHYSSEVWRSINITYRSMGGSAQYDIADDVAQEVVDTIETIAEQCGSYASPQTRLNGLSTLRKIGKTIALSSNDTVGHEVQNWFQSDSSLVEGMIKIISSMTADEIRAIRENKSSQGALWPKLQELEDLADSHCIHPGLAEVLDILDPTRGEDEEEGDEGEEEGEDEEYWDNHERNEEEDADEDDVHQARP